MKLEWTFHHLPGASSRLTSYRAGLTIFTWHIDANYPFRFFMGPYVLSTLVDEQRNEGYYEPGPHFNAQNINQAAN